MIDFRKSKQLSTSYADTYTRDGTLHPLADVPPELIQLGRETMRDMSDVDMADPEDRAAAADAFLLALHKAGHLKVASRITIVSAGRALYQMLEAVQPAMAAPATAETVVDVSRVDDTLTRMEADELRLLDAAVTELANRTRRIRRQRGIT